MNTLQTRQDKKKSVNNKDNMEKQNNKKKNTNTVTRNSDEPSNKIKHKEKIENINKAATSKAEHKEEVGAVDSSSSEETSSSSSDSNSESSSEEDLQHNSTNKTLVTEEKKRDTEYYKETSNSELCKDEKCSNSNVRILPGKINNNIVRIQNGSSTEENNKIYFSIKSKEYCFLSNSYVSDIVIDKERYFHVEGYFQSRKFYAYNSKAAKHIQFVADPTIAKMRAANYSLPEEALEVWNTKLKDKEMMRAVLVKFVGNQELCQKLLDTNNSILVQNDVTDSYWACGKDNRGENKLGKILMKVRSILQNFNDK